MHFIFCLLCYVLYHNYYSIHLCNKCCHCVYGWTMTLQVSRKTLWNSSCVHFNHFPYHRGDDQEIKTVAGNFHYIFGTRKCRVGKVVGSTNAAGNKTTAIKEFSSYFSVDAGNAEMTQQSHPVWQNVTSLFHTLHIHEYDICLLSLIYGINNRRSSPMTDAAFLFLFFSSPLAMSNMSPTFLFSSLF